MIHRHLDIPAGTAVADLPSAALVDILDRGDLDDWRELVVAVRRDPEGPLARRVAGLLDAFPMYGTSPLWRAFLALQRARAEGGAASGAPLTLRQLRERADLSQIELAARMGISQSDLSKLERRGDVKVSTLRAFVRAAGLELRLVAEGPDGGAEIRFGPSPGGSGR